MFDVDVEYDYVPAHRSEQAELLIERVTLAEAVKERDLDDKIINTYPKGMDARKLPGWDKTDDDYVFTELRDRIESSM